MWGFRRFALIFCLVFFCIPVFAQGSVLTFTPYTWESEDIALLVPQGWSVEPEERQVTFRSGDEFLTLSILADTTTDAEIRAEFDALLRSLNMATGQYTTPTVFGLSGWQAEGRIGNLNVFATAGRFPDRRVLTFVFAISPPALALDTAQTLLGSLVWSAQSEPPVRDYGLLWRTPTLADIEAEMTEPYLNLTGITILPSGQIAAVDIDRGVILLDPSTGAVVSETPFENPAQPTAIVADARSTLYISDMACRCLRVLSGNQWLENIGAFGGGAPFDMVMDADGMIYVADVVDALYAVRRFHPTNPTAIETLTLNFNDVAPPTLTAYAGQVYVVQWLESLLDDQVHGSLAQLVDEGEMRLETLAWMPFTRDEVKDIVLFPDHSVLISTADGAWTQFNPDGDVNPWLTLETPARGLAYRATDGALLSIERSGTISAWSLNAPSEQQGSSILLAEVPVQGRLNENLLEQRWTFEGTAGSHISLNVIDPTQTHQLDSAVRLFAPAGNEIAYNDDHRGQDLYSYYDAQIRDVILPESGEYTIVVEWVQGEGTYTLALTETQTFDLNTSGTLHGHLMDVIPVQGWAFEGVDGQTVTFTMFAESGNLDPALELIAPNGASIAYVDDALDPELGQNSQIFRFTLPSNGRYVLEASRYDGTGHYSIVAFLN